MIILYIHLLIFKIMSFSDEDESPPQFLAQFDSYSPGDTLKTGTPDFLLELEQPKIKFFASFITI